MKNLKNPSLMLIVLAIIMTFSISASGAIPKGYWSYQPSFADAVSSGNDEEIIRLGREIAKLFDDAPMDQDKAGILYMIYSEMAPAFERVGDYESAITCWNALLPYGEYLGYDDGVKIAKARIRKIDPISEVYVLTQNQESVPYFNAKHEPALGTYFGRTYDESSMDLKDSETIVSFYVECLDENIENFDYFIRPFADGQRIIHIALNMPRENESLKEVMNSSSDAYLQNTMKYLQSLNVPVLLRIGGEMDVWTDLADTELYKQAFIKVANIARTTAPNVATVFSPNCISNWTVDINDYYPGDEYVDWVGVSLYTNQFFNPSNPTPQEDYQEMFYNNGIYANPITTLKDVVDRFGDRKPIIITESGTAHSINGSDVNMTDFAKDNLIKLYTYSSMVFPQVKGVIYFDTDQGKSGQYNYSFHKNTALKTQYELLIVDNKTLIKNLNEKAFSYTKASNYSDNLPVIELAAYCILPGNAPVIVTYYLDENAILETSQIPYKCAIQTSSLQAGNHELKVVFKSQNGYSSTKVYTINMDESGTVKMT